jgi:hypothetical protein
MPKKILDEKFWMNVNHTDSCWLWTGIKDKKGYGVIGNEKAHRRAYRLMLGTIPEGMLVCHHCDVPGCVKYAHLFLGTHKDNSRDASAKGRLGGENHYMVCNPHKGDQAHCRKLSSYQVLEIKKRDNESPTALAREYSVSRGAIRGILSGKNWGHLSCS